MLEHSPIYIYKYIYHGYSRRHLPVQHICCLPIFPQLGHCENAASLSEEAFGASNTADTSIPKIWFVIVAGTCIASVFGTPAKDAMVGWRSTSSVKEDVCWPMAAVFQGTLIIKGTRVASSNSVCLSQRPCSPLDGFERGRRHGPEPETYIRCSS